MITAARQVGGDGLVPRVRSSEAVGWSFVIVFTTCATEFHNPREGDTGQEAAGAIAFPGKGVLQVIDMTATYSTDTFCLVTSQQPADQVA
jgi:hypothetical protein